MALSYGSQGDDVKKLQQQLNAAGYKIAVDGIYGSATQNAVKSYQQSKGLTVDGIAGTQTLGSLGGGTKAPTAAAAPAPTKPSEGLNTDPNTTPTAGTTMTAPEPMETPKAPAVKAAPEYQPSQAYNDALSALQTHQANMPGQYVSPYGDRINELYEQYVNRGPFNYDFNADAIYQQYKDRYTQQGKQAMQDTMASAAGLTGGYGNSYAAAAGQQEYDRYLQGLNDVIPQLAQNAYEKWQAGGDDMIKQLQLMQGMDEDAYNRSRDQLQDYYTQLNYLAGQEGDAYNRDYGAYQDALAAYQKDRAQALDEAEFEAKYGYKPDDANVSQGYAAALRNAAQMTAQDALAYLTSMAQNGYITPEEADYIYQAELAGGKLAKAASGGGSGSKSSGGTYTPPADTADAGDEDNGSRYMTLLYQTAKDNGVSAKDAADYIDYAYDTSGMTEEQKKTAKAIVSARLNALNRGLTPTTPTSK